MEKEKVINTLVKLASTLNEQTPYQFIQSSALLLQGIEVQPSEREYVEVQWDLFEDLYSYFQGQVVTPVTKTARQAIFSILIDEIEVQVQCQFNTTVRTNPYRIAVNKSGVEVWVESLYSYMYQSSNFEKKIHTYLAKLQNEITTINEQAWNQDQYDALVSRYGEQEVMVKKIMDNPEWRLHPFYKYFGNVKDKRIVHLLGSNGIKGVALSVLGANVTIVDFSKENEMYAQKLAEAAGVTIDYIRSDVFSIPRETIQNRADFVLMELGVLHYFVDLHPLIQVIKSILKQGGQFLLHEFHPISTKLITSSGKKHKVTGNYFTPTIEEQRVAFSKHIGGEAEDNLGKVLQRKWTIGEVVTAIAKEGLVIKVLEEEPNHKVHDIGLPKTYTILAEK